MPLSFRAYVAPLLHSPLSASLRVCSPLPLFKALRHSSGVVNFRSSRALLLKHFYGAAGAASVTAATGGALAGGATLAFDADAGATLPACNASTTSLLLMTPAVGIVKKKKWD